LYDGWKNDFPIDLNNAVKFAVVGGFILLLGAGSIEEAGIFAGLGLEGVFGAEGFEALLANMQDFFI
jgi:hypothetical protein